MNNDSGFVRGGFGCRDCRRKWNCIEDCGGFDGRSYQNFLRDGYIVEVLGERETVFGTVWCQLNHSTIRTNVKRPHACTWFGVCSYRKLKVKVEKKKDLCPICGEELVKLHYLGDRHVVKDKRESGYVPWFFDNSLGDDGLPN